MISAECVRELRKKLELTQQEFAIKLGVSFATINRWEGNHNKPSRMAESKLRELLNNNGSKNE